MTEILIKIVESQLQNVSNLKEKTPDFIRKVVHLYTVQLTKAGTIPLVFLDEVLTEIEEEAIEIYRKKTYGFLTLEEYRRHKFRQLDDN